MILGRAEILRLTEEDGLIENFDENCLESAGYDLRVDRIYTLDKASSIKVSAVNPPEITEADFDLYELKPNQYILLETYEKVNMPSDIVGRILPRSSVFRCGCMLATAVVDPGFHGTLTLGLKNVSSAAFKLERKARVAQILFEEVRGLTKPYSGRYQGGKVV